MISLRIVPPSPSAHTSLDHLAPPRHTDLHAPLFTSEATPRVADEGTPSKATRASRRVRPSHGPSRLPRLGVISRVRGVIKYSYQGRGNGWDMSIDTARRADGNRQVWLGAPEVLFSDFQLHQYRKNRGTNLVGHRTRIWFTSPFADSGAALSSSSVSRCAFVSALLACSASSLHHQITVKNVESQRRSRKSSTRSQSSAVAHRPKTTPSTSIGTRSALRHSPLSSDVLRCGTLGVDGLSARRRSS